MIKFIKNIIFLNWMKKDFVIRNFILFLFAAIAIRIYRQEIDNTFMGLLTAQLGLILGDKTWVKLYNKENGKKNAKKN